MLKKSAAARPSLSLRVAEMFCTTYPPPPGSAPGYQVAHQLTPSSAASVMVGKTHAPLPLGQNASTSREWPKIVPAGAAAGCASPSFEYKTSPPPTARHDTTARTIAPPISKQYCNPCAAVIPQ